MDDALRFLAAYGPLILTVVMFLDQIAIPVPPEPFLLGAGALVAQHRLNAGLAAVLCVAAALAGNAVLYFLGRAKGVRILRFLCRISLEPDSCVRRMEEFFLKHGTKSLVVSKFIPGLNTISPAVAGIVRIKPGPFFFFDGIGAAVWILAWGLLGYLFHRQLEGVASFAASLGTVSLGIVVCLMGAYVLSKFLHRRRVLGELAAARISAEELKKMMDANHPVVVLDARHALDLKSDSYRIPGAILMTPEEIEHRHEEIPRDRDIVVYCS